MYLIAITSGKGGTGKSCVTAYTGIALSESNKKTLMIEMGLSPRSLDIITAAQEDTAFDIHDVLQGHCSPHDAVAQAPYTENLYLLTAPPGRYQKPDAPAMLALIKQFRKEYDYVLIDGADFDVLPPSLFDTILMVSTPDTLSVRACREHTRELYETGAEHIRFVINNVPAEIIPIYGAEDFDDVINIVGAQLIAVIPHSPKLAYSSNNSVQQDESSITIQVFDNLAARLRGQPRPLLIC